MRTTSATPDLLTPDEAAATLRVSRQTIKHRVDDGTLRAVRLGSITRIPRAELDRVLEADDAVDA